MKTCITISTYNRDRSIKRAVDSALNQVRPSEYVLVIDDNSQDQTEKILEEYFSNPSFCYIKLSENIGTYQIRNLALSICDAEAFAFHDSDDIAHMDKLLIQSRIIEQRKVKLPEYLKEYTWENFSEKIHFVSSNSEYVFIDGKTEIMGSFGSLVRNALPNLFYPNAEKHSYTNTTHALIAREVFTTLGGYLPYRVACDVEMRDRALLFGFNFYHVDVPLMKMYSNDDSLTVAGETGLTSDYRGEIRKIVAARVQEMRETPNKRDFAEKFKSEISIENLVIETISNKSILSLSDDMPIDPATKHKISAYINA